MAISRENQRLEYVAKPATTALLTSAALTGGANGWVIAALLLCLAGDVFLMLPQDLFVPGLASFLVGHMLFIVAFFADRGGDAALWLSVPLAAAVVLASARPVLRGATAQDPALRVPVAAYISVIALMTVASALPGSWLAIAGAAVFVLSDSILARHRFVRPIPHGDLAVMVTYHAALALLVVAAT